MVRVNQAAENNDIFSLRVILREALGTLGRPAAVPDADGFQPGV